MRRNYKERTLRSRLSEPFYNPLQDSHRKRADYTRVEVGSENSNCQETGEHDNLRGRPVPLQSCAELGLSPGDYSQGTKTVTLREGELSNAIDGQVQPFVRDKTPDTYTAHLSSLESAVTQTEDMGRLRRADEIFPFGSFCRRGNYCIRCGFECKQKEHARKTKELFDNILTWKD